MILDKKKSARVKTWMEFQLGPAIRYGYKFTFIELIQHHIMPVVLGKPVEYFSRKNFMDIWKTSAKHIHVVYTRRLKEVVG